MANKFEADISDAQEGWVIQFCKDSGLQRSSLLREMLEHYRGSTAPRLLLLEERVHRLQEQIRQLKRPIAKGKAV